MSFDVSWVAFNTVRKQDVLSVTGFRDTGELEEINEAPFSCAELPTGWTVLFANNSTFVNEHIKTISANHAVLSMIVQGYVPLSFAQFHVRGERVWGVVHNGAKDAINLGMMGQVPPQAEPIRDHVLSLIKADGGNPANVDYMYDAPIELARSVCGYRHDRWRFDWGQPKFTVVEPSYVPH